MHVVLTTDPEIPVPPRLYGGIERIVESLVRGLLARGHEVTLFAHPDSQVACELRPWRGRASASRRDTLQHIAQLASYVGAGRRRDLVIHSFARLAYMLPLLPRAIPKLQTYERAVTPRSVMAGHVLSRGTLEFSACSASCASSGNATGRWHVVYNGVDVERYRFRDAVAADAPLMFLGRLDRIKGAHTAIEVARRTGRRLIVAGNAPTTGSDVEYARALIAQCDGRQIEYVGPVDDARKDELLGKAACLLMPIEWEEPFGIVMAEALACGTPVLGFPRGSVPEVVQDGVSGFLCRDLDAMTAAVARIPELRRADSRRAAETRFSADVMVANYLAVYEAIRARLGIS